MSLTGKLLLNEYVSLGFDLNNLKELNNKEYENKEDKNIKEQNKTNFFNKLKKGLATGLVGLMLYGSSLGILGLSGCSSNPSNIVLPNQSEISQEELQENYFIGSNHQKVFYEEVLPYFNDLSDFLKEQGFTDPRNTTVDIIERCLFWGIDEFPNAEKHPLLRYDTDIKVFFDTSNISKENISFYESILQDTLEELKNKVFSSFDYIDIYQVNSNPNMIIKIVDKNEFINNYRKLKDLNLLKKKDKSSPYPSAAYNRLDDMINSKILKTTLFFLNKDEIIKAYLSGYSQNEKEKYLNQFYNRVFREEISQGIFIMNDQDIYKYSLFTETNDSDYCWNVPPHINRFESDIMKIGLILPYGTTFDQIEDFRKKYLKNL